MKYEHLIAQRFLQRDKHNFSRPLVNIATYTIALGIVVMIMAVSILRGFQQNITDKVTGFGAHITVHSQAWTADYDDAYITMSPSEADALRHLPLIANIQPTATKGGMLKTDSQIQGIILKGIDHTFDTTFFARNLVSGHLPATGDTNATNQIIISQRLAQKMDLNLGDKARTYFWADNTYRARALLVTGIYNTDLAEFDDHYIIGNIDLIRRLNNWPPDAASAYEINIRNFSQLDQALALVKDNTPFNLAVHSIVEQQPSMFAWLNLLNSNIILILIILAVVTSASIVSALLIMIFEKTAMIGLLKTLGATNRSIRHIFILKANTIILKALILGNAVAAALCLIQHHLHILRLDPESYSMPYVPIDPNPLIFILVSIATAAIANAALLIPTTAIAHIHPAKTTRQE